AITESYVPLLDMVEGLERDDVPGRFTMSLSPTLLAMLTDPVLRGRYRRHLAALVGLSEDEERRTRGEPGWHRCALLYRERLGGVRARVLGHRREGLVRGL